MVVAVAGCRRGVPAGALAERGGLQPAVRPGNPGSVSLPTRGCAPALPVHRSRLLEAWVFTCYADVEAILRDYRRFSNMPSNRRAPRRRRIYVPPRADWTMLFLDPPEHTRLRALVNQAFTPRVVDALEPHIRAIMGELLDDIDDSAGFDLMAAVANPLPVIVIAEMLGVPPKDRDRFKHWSNARARMLEPTITAQERARAVAAGEALDAYFMPIIQARRREPRDDIISALAQAEEEGDSLTEREMLLMLRLLLIAGNETTTNLIGNGALALLQHPEQLALLREDPSRIPAAMEELLRFDTPGPARHPGRAGGLRNTRRPRCGAATAPSWPSARPTATRRYSTTRSGSMSSAPRAATSPSAAASTTVSARHSHGWKGASPWRCSWSAIPL